MTKNLKLNIKNPQIAGAINLGGLKAKLAKQKGNSEEEILPPPPSLPAEEKATKAKKKTSAKGEPEVETEASSSEKKKKTVRSKAKEELGGEIEAAPEKAKVEEKKVAEVKKQELIVPIAATEKMPEVLQERAPQQAASTKIESSAAKPVQSAQSSQQTPSFPRPSTGTFAPRSQGYSSSQPPRRQEFSQPERRSAGSSSSRPAPFKPQPFQAKPLPPQPEIDSSSDRSFVRPTPREEQKAPAQPSERPPYQPGTRPPYQQGSRPPYQGDRPAYQGDRPPYQQGTRPPYQQGSRPPYQGDRPAYQGDRPPYQPGTRPPYQQGSRPPYQGDRPAYQADRPPYQPGTRPPYQQGSRPPYQGDRPPYQPRRDGAGAPPRGFGPGPRPAMPPHIKEGELRKEPDAKERSLEEQKRTRHDFGEAASKFQKGKLKDTAASKLVRKPEESAYDVRTRHGFVSADEEGGTWRSRRRPKMSRQATQEIVRPSKIKVRLPISIKDLALEMKLKASELISKLFIQGLVVTLNDVLDDPLALALLGHEFGCEIAIDTAEAERIRISDKNVREEISTESEGQLVRRPPVVAFMGHVDHGKTSLVDAIRKSNRAAKEVGAITQHIGAFTCTTSHGTITILDTPGHEAFTLMRERGATLTDIVVLVVAGDEGIQEQTVEAIKQARNAKATIVVALTKCDKPSFDAELIYRQLSDKELLPEAWGGQTVTVNCSAVSGVGVQELLEMLALQAEVLELKANPSQRARGTVIESQMQQGLGAVATILVQNGTLHTGDSLVFGGEFARVKSMRNENSADLKDATPSTPVLITGLSGLPEAGEEFIVVKNEKEAKEIAEVRREGKRQSSFQLKKRATMESLMETASLVPKKTLTLILKADVQGSLEALTKVLEKIVSDKVEINIISQGVGQVSESDVQLAATSGAIILGFHTAVEPHVDSLIKEIGVKISLQDIIYHAADHVKELMKTLLDKLPEEVEKGKAEVKAAFKASHLGVIAGCQVIEGTVSRNSKIRVKRGNEVVWKGTMSSLKRVKDDVKEVQKGIECGILLSGYDDVKIGDILEAYDIVYIAQEL